jgi:chromosome segregation ATPase
MNATLIDSPLPTASANREAELAALVVPLREEVQQLRHEVTELRQQVGYWKSMHDRAVRRNEKLQQRVDELEAENRQLKDRLFGSKSEKGSRKDRSNQLENPDQSSGKPKRRRGHQPDHVPSAASRGKR